MPSTPEAQPSLPTQPAAVADKATWRAWAHTVRALLTTGERSQRVTDAIRSWEPFGDARVVLAYLAFGTEIDLQPLFAGREHAVLVPRSIGGREPRLTLHRLDPGGLEAHPYGMRQPEAGSAEAEPDEVDLALLPGLCFDRGGHRLGYGHGYYDRFLRRLRPGIPLVAVGFDALVVNRLPREDHDVAATHLATESGVRAVAGAVSTQRRDQPR